VHSLERIFYRYFLPIFSSFGWGVSEEKIKILYENCSFRPDRLSNMAATGNSCFWLVDFLKIFSSVKRKITLALRRRLKCEKLTDDRWRTPSDGKSSHCLWQGELIMAHWLRFLSDISVKISRLQIKLISARTKNTPLPPKFNYCSCMTMSSLKCNPFSLEFFFQMN
jgi:hypothetical protein